MKFSISKKMGYLIYMVSVITLIFFAFNIYVTFQIHKQLGEMSSKPPRWPLGSYVYDPNIGFDFAENISDFIQDSSFYVKSHQLGFRISQHQDASISKPGGILSLGCSFTYGDEVESEQTFTQFIADSLGIPAYNYGVCSFSYIHALQKAKNLKEEGILDKLQPKYVILGCWKGLPNRSRTPFPRIVSKNVPLTAASIYKDNTKLSIRYPVSVPQAFELLTMYRKDGAELSAQKFMKIFTSVPRFAYIYLKNNRLYQKMREVNTSTQISNFEVYDFYFTGIEKLFPSQQTLTIVLHMPTTPNDQPDAGFVEALRKHPDILFVNGLDAIQRYEVPLKDYKGKHPQSKAHQSYALETIKVLRTAEIIEK